MKDTRGHWDREKDVAELLEALKQLIKTSEAVADAFIMTDANDETAFVMAWHECRKAIAAGQEAIKKIESKPSEFLF